MDWVDSLGKRRNTSTLLQEFESRFVRLSTLDRTVLDTSKVLLFVKSFDLLDRDNVGLLLETNDGLTVDRAVVKGVCGRIDKRRDWKEKGSSIVGPTLKTRADPTPTRTKETRRWLESSLAPPNVVAGPSEGVDLEELTKMKEPEEIVPTSANHSRAMWCTFGMVGYTPAIREGPWR